MRLSLLTPPELEPLAPGEVIAHLRLDEETPEDEWIADHIRAAREHVESLTGRQLLPATWVLTLDEFPSYAEPLELPLPPLRTVTTIVYRDAEGVLTTWDPGDYVVDAPRGPRCLEGRIFPSPAAVYPTPQNRRESVTITYLAGYDDPHAVPMPIRQAMLLLVGHWYENREATVVGTTPVDLPIGVEALLAPYVRWSGLIR